MARSARTLCWNGHASSRDAALVAPHCGPVKGPAGETLFGKLRRVRDPTGLADLVLTARGENRLDRATLAGRGLHEHCPDLSDDVAGLQSVVGFLGREEHKPLRGSSGPNTGNCFNTAVNRKDGFRKRAVGGGLNLPLNGDQNPVASSKTSAPE